VRELSEDAPMTKACVFVLVAITACGGKTSQPPVESPKATAAVDAKQPAAVEAPPAEQPSAELGKQLFGNKGCVACHTIDGSPRVGPSLQGVFGTQVTLEGGATVLFDDAYFRESVLSPQAKLVAGFPPVQPSYEGQLTDAELAGLLAYVKSLR
jgi:cytochrome c oxidase subunit 2